MSTLYSTYVCGGCGTTFPVNQRCPKCAPMTEERLMKIVQDMQRRDQGYIDERIREIATEIAREEFRASKNDEWPWMDHPEKWDAMKREARDSALEEAAAYVAGKGRSKDASEIRSLKSQPAAQASAPQIVGTSCVGWADPLKHEALLLENSELRKERDELRAKLATAEEQERVYKNLALMARSDCEDRGIRVTELSALLQVRTEKLAEAEKALDEIAGEVGHDGCIVRILKRTGRLTPRKQEEPK